MKIIGQIILVLIITVLLLGGFAVMGSIYIGCSQKGGIVVKDMYGIMRCVKGVDMIPIYP